MRLYQVEDLDGISYGKLFTDKSEAEAYRNSLMQRARRGEMYTGLPMTLFVVQVGKIKSSGESA